MAKKQFSKVNAARGAPMGRCDDGTVALCTPRTARLFRVNLDSQGYDDGGAYWGHGGALWCAIGEHETGLPARQFVRADSREAAIVALNLEAGTLRQGPTINRLALLMRAAQSGNVQARELVKNLNYLGYDIPYNPAENHRANGF